MGVQGSPEAPSKLMGLITERWALSSPADEDGGAVLFQGLLFHHHGTDFLHWPRLRRPAAQRPVGTGVPQD